MYQYYVVEVKETSADVFTHNVYTFSNADAGTARSAAEAKYYDVLADAAASSLATYSAILMSSECFPLMHQCYTTRTTHGRCLLNGSCSI